MEVAEPFHHQEEPLLSVRLIEVDADTIRVVVFGSTEDKDHSPLLRMRVYLRKLVRQRDALLASLAERKKSLAGHMDRLHLFNDVKDAADALVDQLATLRQESISETLEFLGY
jgi:uncharacterized linocin/CFP29 family protein